MWQHVPQTVPIRIQRQIEHLCHQLDWIRSGNRIGIYLHGSLAMGCFHPQHSDVDLIVVSEKALPIEAKRMVIESMLDASRNPAPVEMSLMTREDFHPWRYPPPFDLHYSERWRQHFESDLKTGAWRDWNTADRTDPDLAAHLTVLHERGLVLRGPAISEVFPQVPREHYIDAILLDYQDARSGIQENPVYGVLNMVRVLRYLAEGRVSSKAEAGQWAKENHSGEIRSILEMALAKYQGMWCETELQPAALRAFVEEIDTSVRAVIDAGWPEDHPGEKDRSDYRIS